MSTRKGRISVMISSSKFKNGMLRSVTRLADRNDPFQC